MENSKHDLYLELLGHFCLKYHLHQDWLKEPFNTSENTAASDTHNLILVPKILDLPDLSEKVSLALRFECAETFLIQIANLKKAIESIPKDAEKCSACGGDGDVEFTFYHKGKSYEKYETCPICDGEGVAKGKDRRTIQVGEDRAFPILNLQNVVLVADKLGVETVKYLVQSPSNWNVKFDFGDVVIITMPISYPENIIASVELIPL
jgi:hypothetical protein